MVSFQLSKSILFSGGNFLELNHNALSVSLDTVEALFVPYSFATPSRQKSKKSVSNLYLRSLRLIKCQKINFHVLSNGLIIQVWALKKYFRNFHGGLKLKVQRGRQINLIYVAYKNSATGNYYCAMIWENYKIYMTSRNILL